MRIFETLLAASASVLVTGATARGGITSRQTAAGTVAADGFVPVTAPLPDNIIPDKNVDGSSGAVVDTPAATPDRSVDDTVDIGSYQMTDYFVAPPDENYVLTIESLGSAEGWTVGGDGDATPGSATSIIATFGGKIKRIRIRRRGSGSGYNPSLLVFDPDYEFIDEDRSVETFFKKRRQIGLNYDMEGKSDEELSEYRRRSADVESTEDDGQDTEKGDTFAFTFKGRPDGSNVKVLKTKNGAYQVRFKARDVTNVDYIERGSDLEGEEEAMVFTGRFQKFQLSGDGADRRLDVVKVDATTGFPLLSVGVRTAQGRGLDEFRIRPARARTTRPSAKPLKL